MLDAGWGVFGLPLMDRRGSVHESLSLELALEELVRLISVMGIGDRDLHFRCGCSFMGVVEVVVVVGWLLSVPLLTSESELSLVEDVAMVTSMLPIFPGCFLDGVRWVSFWGVLRTR